jgi:membrane-bound lytic murein transglycosylase B
LIRNLFSIALLLIAACAIPAGASDLKRSKPAAKKSVNAKAKRKPVVSPQAGPAYAARADAMALADGIAERRKLDRNWVRHAIGQAHFMPGIARAATPPPVGMPKNWELYRSRFIEPIRINAGVKFWQAHKETLERAEAQTGVPAAIIVGIIGVETIYGQHTGNYRVMDALCTLALDFPQEHPRAKDRAAFFQRELESYLALTHRTATEPLALKGSYAGAMGLPQFMPSSWDKYAIDFDGDGRIDLFNSRADVIGSVANYFKAFQWKPGMPTHYTLQFDRSTLDLPALLAPDILPTFTTDALAAKGVLLDEAGQKHTGPLALVELQNGGEPPLYVAGTENFYVITRYNWSSYYAMAVIELGQEVGAAMQSVAGVPK